MIDLGNRLELFVDHFLIDTHYGTALKLHHPRPANVALPFDQPWEGAFSGYSTVIPDGDHVLLFYRGWPEARRDAASVCIARSTDGIAFERIDTGLVELDGSKANNILLHGDETAHNFAPVLDTRPGVPDDERFKALASCRFNDQRGLVAFASADGIHWRKLREEPVITKGAFDSQNVAFWSAHEGCYVAYYRTWDAALDPTEFKGKRTISRATSDDFLTWSDGTVMSYGDTPAEELYTNRTFPYPRAPHIYISLPKRFTPGRRTLSDEEIQRFGLVEPYFNDVSDGVLMTSRGGTRYDRTFMEAFLRPGAERANWVSRTNMAANGLVQTGDREISLYYHQRYAQPAQYLQQFTLRLDGFISLNAPYAGGETITRPFTFSGRRLVFNYDTSGPGDIRTELLTAEGTPIPGFTLDEATPIYGDELERTVSWGERHDLADLAGKPVRLRLVMRDADLYSLRFAD